MVAFPRRRSGGRASPGRGRGGRAARAARVVASRARGGGLARRGRAPSLDFRWCPDALGGCEAPCGCRPGLRACRGVAGGVGASNGQVRSLLTSLLVVDSVEGVVGLPVFSCGCALSCGCVVGRARVSAFSIWHSVYGLGRWSLIVYGEVAPKPSLDGGLPLQWRRGDVPPLLRNSRSLLTYTLQGPMG